MTNKVISHDLSLSFPTYNSTYIRMTATNIFGTADAIAALIWSSVLATTILVIMLAIQRILSMKEIMESWVEGVKDVIEPLIILLLAWALGSVIAVSYVYSNTTCKHIRHIQLVHHQYLVS